MNSKQQGGTFHFSLMSGKSTKYKQPNQKIKNQILTVNMYKELEKNCNFYYFEKQQIIFYPSYQPIQPNN